MSYRTYLTIALVGSVLMIGALAALGYLIFSNITNPALLTKAETVTTPFAWAFAVYAIIRWFRIKGQPRRIR